MFSTLEHYIQEQVVSQAVPGFSLAIIKDQEVVYSNGFGVTHLEDGGVPVTANTLFRIGSLSKPLTATAIMILVDQGKLDLDLPIIEYVPFFTLKDFDAARKITLRMLLSHTSGLPDGTDIVGSRNVDALEQYVRHDVPELSMIAPPGLLFSYSNHGFNIAGYVAEYVTQTYFPELMQDLLFKPLGMSRTLYDPLMAMTYSLALGHEKTETGHIVVRPFYENAANYPSWFAMSTATDYAKFLLMHLNTTTLLSTTAIREMQTMQVSRYNLQQLGCGLSFITEDYKGTPTIRHGGAIGTYTSFMLAAPEQQLAIVTLASQDYGIDLAYEIFDQLLKTTPDHKEPEVMIPKPADWERYTGYYLGNQSGLVQIINDGQQLKIHLNGTEMMLYAHQDNLYFTQDTDENPIVTIGFVEDENEDVDYIVLNGQTCKRIEQEQVTQPTINWSAVDGTYSNGSISFGLKVVNNQLFLLDEDQEYTCHPLFGPFFFTEEQGLLEIRESEYRNILIVQGSWEFDQLGIESSPI